jgi:hypothetical protein
VLAAAAVTAGTLVAVTPGSPAQAICDNPNIIYSFTGKQYTKLPTNVYTPWLQGPHSISLSQTTTATATAQVTATVSAEAGVVFAKASTSLGVTVGGSWSKSTTWTATASVPKGKQGRLRLYHDALGFTVTKKKLVSPCKYVTIYTSKVIAPRKTGEDVVNLDLRAIPKNAPSPAPGQDGGPDTSDSPVIGQEPVTTIPVDGDLTDYAPPNGLPDEPIVEDPADDPSEG